MSEDIDPLTTGETTQPISHRGILIMMSVLVGFLALAGFVFAGAMFGFGVMLGGGLSFVNYFWLQRSTAAMFDQSALATTGLLAAKYILRYFVIGAALLLIYSTGAFPVAAVIIGLSTFAFAVVLQGLKNIFSSSL